MLLVNPVFRSQKKDISLIANLLIDVLQLIDKARKLFRIHDLSTDWKIVEKVEPDQLINSLSMICPFSVSEKQGLLEAKTLLERNLLINQIINFYIIGNNPGSERQIH